MEKILPQKNPSQGNQQSITRSHSMTDHHDTNSNSVQFALAILQQDDWIRAKVCAARADKRKKITNEEVAIKLKKRASEFDPNKSTNKHNLE